MDSGVPVPDAGCAVDASSIEDASGLADAGCAADASSIDDAGGLADSGCAVDASFVVDAACGAKPCAAPVDDAGIEP